MKEFQDLHVRMNTLRENHITSLTTRSYKYPHKASQVLAIKLKNTRPCHISCSYIKAKAFTTRASQAI